MDAYYSKSLEASRRIFQSAMAHMAIPKPYFNRKEALKNYIRRLNAPHTEAEEAYDEVMKELEEERANRMFPNAAKELNQ